MNMEKRGWKEGSDVMKSDLVKEEMEIYKERLKEMEMAFRYNLSLLADRDAELDIIEEQLRNGIIQLEKVTKEKMECDKVLRLLREEKLEDSRLFKKKLFERENAIKELERRNNGNLRTLKKALEDLKMEQREEKQQMEKNFIRVIQMKESEHLKEMRRLERKLTEAFNEAMKERQLFDAENRNLKKLLFEAQQKEKSEIVRLKHLQRMCKKGSEQATRMENKETMTKYLFFDIGTQTVNEDHPELKMLREQNEVLKKIIKNLKRKIELEGSERKECGECEIVKEKIEETNRRFEAELMQVKKEVERERTEEETIIQSLENSVSSLKEKLLRSLTGGDVFVLEDRLNEKLEKIDQKLDEVSQRMEDYPRSATHSTTTRNNYH